MLKQHFLEAVSTYQPNASQLNRYWAEIEKAYTGRSRHYHTLTHLEHVLSELLPHKHVFSNWHTVVLAIAYHDAVYNPLKKNNEERSAQLAEKRLTEIQFVERERNQCTTLILATKKHEPADEETNLFTDADLSILGAKPEHYKNYTQQIRKEYSMYPDLLYRPGRNKVLLHFLNMDTIYKTKAFSNRYEAQARQNLLAELQANGSPAS